MSMVDAESKIAKPKSSGLSPSAGLLLQRKCACGGSPGVSGECEACKQKRLQKKLSIGASNDPLEAEADRVADQVMAMSPNSGVSKAPPRIQRFTGQAVGEAGAAPASVDRVLSASGRPLDPALQQDMGRRFGYDFSQVRVHTGAEAEQSAREVDAHAYTVGHNVVFGAGQFSPESHGGRRLIAHELTHVVQQSGERLNGNASHYSNSAIDVHVRDTVNSDCERSQNRSAKISSRANAILQRECAGKSGWNYEYDGCSLPQWVVFLIGTSDKDNPALGRDTHFSRPDRMAPCDLHDHCYQTCHRDRGGQERCDREMYENMMSVCRSSTESPGILGRCFHYAGVYYAGLRQFGGSAYRERQAQVCACKAELGDFPVIPGMGSIA